MNICKNTCLLSNMGILSIRLTTGRYILICLCVFIYVYMNTCKNTCLLSNMGILSVRLTAGRYILICLCVLICNTHLFFPFHLHSSKCICTFICVCVYIYVLIYWYCIIFNIKTDGICYLSTGFGLNGSTGLGGMGSISSHAADEFPSQYPGIASPITSPRLLSPRLGNAYINLWICACIYIYIYHINKFNTLTFIYVNMNRYNNPIYK
jgi:hypothetical protein